jgi:hypothetical protein
VKMYREPMQPNTQPNTQPRTPVAKDSVPQPR